MIETKILTKKKFSEMVEKRVIKSNDTTYLEACLAICEELEYPPEDVGKLISPSLYSKLEAEAARVRLIKTMTNTHALPI